jgi:hypothetical protein
MKLFPFFVHVCYDMEFKQKTSVACSFGQLYVIHFLQNDTKSLLAHILSHLMGEVRLLIELW